MNRWFFKEMYTLALDYYLPFISSSRIIKRKRDFKFNKRERINNKYSTPHQSKREKERRMRQIEKGIIKVN